MEHARETIMIGASCLLFAAFAAYWFLILLNEISRERRESEEWHTCPRCKRWVNPTTNLPVMNLPRGVNAHYSHAAQHCTNCETISKAMAAQFKSH